MRPVTDENWAEATRLANHIEAVLSGNNRVSCILALSAVIGTSATRTPRRDFDGFMRIIQTAAKEYYDVEMHRLGVSQ